MKAIIKCWRKKATKSKQNCPLLGSELKNLQFKIQKMLHKIELDLKKQDKSAPDSDKSFNEKQKITEELVLNTPKTEESVHKVELKISPCKIYECEICSKVFCTLKNLEAHKFNIHDMEEIVKKIDLNNDSGSKTDMKVRKTEETFKNKVEESLSKTISSPSNPGLGVALVINKKVLKSIDNTPLIEQTQYQRISMRTSMQGFSTDNVFNSTFLFDSEIAKNKTVNKTENKTETKMEIDNPKINQAQKQYSMIRMALRNVVSLDSI